MRGVIIVGAIQFQTVRVAQKQCPRNISNFISNSSFSMQGQKCYDFSQAGLLTSDISSTNMSWGKYENLDLSETDFIVNGNNMQYDDAYGY